MTTRPQRRGPQVKFLRPAAIVAIAALATAALVAESPAKPAYADSQLTQLQNFYTANDATKGWVDLSQTDVSYLRAVEATLGGSGLSASGDPEHEDEVSGWSNTSQSMSWPVHNTTAGNFVVNVILGSGSGTIKVSDGSSSTSYTYASSEGGWDKTNFGQISVPSGSSTITIQETSSTGGTMELLSLELTPASQAATLAAAYAAGQSNATWMKSSPLGVMYQWGQWGANENGTEPAWPVVYQNANFAALAARDKAMGASYVVWSITWTQYYVAAPISSVDSVLTGRTTTTDYLQNMLTAFHNAGLRVIFYYHDGHDSNPNADWWNAFWGDVPSAGFWAERATAMNRWLNIVSEIGTRYGTQLDGWLFDDASTYYPLPQGMLNTAVRAGNPNRLVSFNATGGAQIPTTPYEDFEFGENNDSTGYAPVNLNGQVLSGGLVGEQGFGNITEDNGDWGVRTGDTTPITPARSQANLTFIAQNAALTHQSVAVDQRMWSDMTQSPDSVARLTAAGQTEAAENPTSMVDDSNSAITYSGGWASSNPGGCFNSTCHNVQATGATAQYTFTGSGITWNSITSWDQGKADVYIDGSFYKTVNLYAATRSVDVPVFSAGLAYGTHTITIDTDNSNWVTVDSFGVQTGGWIDDSNPSVTYTGSWANSNPGGCFANTCHNIQAAGATAQTSFTGTGVTWYSITAPDQGSADVYIDGTFKQTVNLYSATRAEAVPVYNVTGLTFGNHTIKVVTDNSSWVSVDAFGVTVANMVDDSSSAIIYTGAWQNSNPGGCFDNTCHNSYTAGASAQYTFTGTGITWNSITAPDQGIADVYIDGTLDETVNLYNAVRTVGVPIYSKYGLAPGSHTIKIVNDNSNWVTLDSFAVTS